MDIYSCTIDDLKRLGKRQGVFIREGVYLF